MTNIEPVDSILEKTVDEFFAENYFHRGLYFAGEVVKGMQDYLNQFGVPIQDIQKRNYLELFGHDALSISHRIAPMEEQAHHMAREIMDYCRVKFLKEINLNGTKSVIEELRQYLMQIYISAIIKMYKAIDRHNHQLLGNIDPDNYPDSLRDPQEPPTVPLKVISKPDELGEPILQYVANPSIVNRN